MPLLGFQAQLSAVLLIHVGARPKPAPHLAVGPQLGHYVRQKPAIFAGRAPQPEFSFKGLPRVQGLAPARVQRRQVIGVNELGPQRLTGGLVQLHHIVAGIVDEALVGIVGFAPNIGSPDELRQVFGQKAELLTLLFGLQRGLRGHFQAPKLFAHIEQAQQQVLVLAGGQWSQQGLPVAQGCRVAGRHQKRHQRLGSAGAGGGQAGLPGFGGGQNGSGGLRGGPQGGQGLAGQRGGRARRQQLGHGRVQLQHGAIGT